MTSRQFWKLPRAERTQVYFSHDLNTVTNKNGSKGPSMRAQAAFVNNWLQAFFDFSNSLRA